MYGPYRRASQLTVFGLMFAVPLLNLYEIYAVTGTFYAINVGRLGVADPVVMLQAVFAAGEVTGPLMASVAFPILLALVLGRVWCGWMCPYHLISDCAVWLRRKLAPWAFRNAGLVRTAPLAGRSLRANISRYGFLLVGTAMAGVVGIPLLNYFSAPGIISTEAMILIKNRHVSFEFGFIALLFVIELAVFPRFWCRMFCPTGSFIALFRTPFTLTIGTGSRRSLQACCKDNHCSPACPMGLAPYKEGNNLLCTNCGRCIDACPHGRLKFRGFASQNTHTGLPTRQQQST
jgi:ferredoxin-type protein NapH